jgi:hypothetical protein
MKISIIFELSDLTEAQRINRYIKEGDNSAILEVLDTYQPKEVLILHATEEEKKNPNCY